MLILPRVYDRISESEKKMNLRIGTFNICHCGDYSKHSINDPFELYNVNIEQTANTIKELNCDIIGLNEVYNDGSDSSIDFKNQTEKLANLSGYKYYYYAQGHDHGWTDIGNAVFSKYPIIKFTKILVPTIPECEQKKDKEYENRVFAIAYIEIDGRIIKFISTHFGLEQIELNRIVKKCCQIIDDSKYSVILAGDFNITPQNTLIKKIDERLKSCALEMGNDEFTFASYNPNRHIDYIYVPKNSKVLSYTVHKIKSSDHFPITADIDI